MRTVAEVMSAMQEIAPLELAAEWDNVGLLLGDPEEPIDTLMTCLTITRDSAAEAIERKAGLIVSHHPILFRPTKKLTSNTPEGRMLVDLLRAGVAVYSAHTAFDNAPGGINDKLAEQLGLIAVEPLRPHAAHEHCKVVVFVPEKDVAKVSDVMFAAGAGEIGQYRECSFRVLGTGTFHGSDASQPAVGQKGRKEEVAEWRLEVLCPQSRVERVVQALRAAHSYEEPAIDVYPLRSGRGKAGEGRVGLLPAPTSLGDFARKVKAALRLDNTQMVGSPNRSVHRIAIACGAAGEFLPAAVAAKADVFLTGEVRFHDALAAEAQGLGLILPGHYATERGAMEALALQLQTLFPDLTVWPSKKEHDPLVNV